MKNSGWKPELHFVFPNGILRVLLFAVYAVCFLLAAQGAVAEDLKFDWAARMGGTSSDQGRAIAVDASGNVYTTGHFYDTADFNPGAGVFNLTSAGNSDMFVSKLDASGNFVWAKAMGGSYHGYGDAIAVDASGNVYTTGYFQGVADFDPGAGVFNLTSAGIWEIFVSKLDASGNFVWAKRMGGTSSDSGSGIAVDASGNAYTTGYFQGIADFDPGPATANLTSAGIQDIFVSKLDASGNYIWAKAIGTAHFDTGSGIAVDSSGNVYTTGYFNQYGPVSGTADFDPGPGTANLLSAGGPDIFVSKLDASGNYVWAKAMGGTSNDLSYGIAVDASGKVYTTGYFFGMADFDPGPDSANLTGGQNRGIFVSKLDALGNYVWARRMGGIGQYDSAQSIAIDASGNVYTTGHFSYTADFDPGPGTANLTAAGTSDYTAIFVSKLDASGNYAGAWRMGGTSWDFSYGIAVDTSGDVYTTGNFEGVSDFDPGPGTANLTGAGGRNIFVSKLYSPSSTDMDSDGLPDTFEIHDTGTNPLDADTDNDGLPDGDEDPDGDGLTNHIEHLAETYPLDSDTDNDGVLDGADDSDGDGLTNSTEATMGTHPGNPDTDADGLWDALELTESYDPFVPDVSLSATLGTPSHDAVFRAAPTTATIPLSGGLLSHHIDSVLLSMDGGLSFPFSATLSGLSWSYSWTGVSIGEYDLVARAGNVFGGYVDTEPVPIRVVAGTGQVPAAILTLPGNGDRVQGTINVTGTAANVIYGTAENNLDSWTLSYRVETDPDAPGAFVDLVTGVAAVTNGVLYAPWNTSALPPGDYRLQLRVRDSGLQPDTVTYALFHIGDIDTTPPGEAANLAVAGEYTAGFAKPGGTITVTGTAEEQAFIHLAEVINPGEVSILDVTTDMNLRLGGTLEGTFTLPVPLNASSVALRVYIKDLAGNISAPAISNLLVVDDLAPGVAIVFPQPNELIPRSAVTITGTASDTGPSGLDRVEVKINSGAYAAATGTANWTFNWTPPSDAAFTVTALAWDGAGNAATQAITTNVHIDNPVAVITSPAIGGTFSAGTPITVIGTANDPVDFSAYRLQYGIGIAPVSWTDIEPPNSVPIVNATLGTWNTSGLSDGPYTLKLIVSDVAGHVVSFRARVNMLSTIGLSGVPDKTTVEDADFLNALHLPDFVSIAAGDKETFAYTITGITDANAGVTIDAGRNIDIAPAANWFGISDVTVKVAIGGLNASDTFRVTVNGTNDPPGAPSISASPTSATDAQDITATVTSPAADIEGDAITYTYTWFKSLDGVSYQGPLRTTATTAALSDVLPASLTAVNDFWRVEVTANDGSLNGPAATAQAVVAGPSTITLTITPETVVLGTPATLSGAITPSAPESSVLFDSTLPPQDGGVVPSTVSADESGAFSTEFYPGQGGTWLMKSNWEGNLEVAGAASNVRLLTVTKAQPSMSVTLNPESGLAGLSTLTAKVPIAAALPDDLRPLLDGLPVTLFIKKPDATSAPSVQGTTAFDAGMGAYVAVFSASAFANAGVVFDQPGIWQFQAQFTGNGNFKTAMSAGFDTAGAARLTLNPTTPVIAIASPTLATTYATTTSSITIAGTASDDIGVTQVTWANNRGGSGTATGTTSWSKSGVGLQTGDNTITVTAHDALGNAGVDILVVTYNTNALLLMRNGFRAKDANGDGKISLAESGLTSTAFNALDTNHNGYLAMSELLAQSVGPVGVATPVWVNFGWVSTETGTQAQPFNTLDEGAVFVKNSGVVKLAGTSPVGFESAVMIPGKAVTLTSTSGTVRIGAVGARPAAFQMTSADRSDPSDSATESLWRKLWNALTGADEEKNIPLTPFEGGIGAAEAEDVVGYLVYEPVMPYEIAWEGRAPSRPNSDYEHDYDDAHETLRVLRADQPIAIRLVSDHPIDTETLWAEVPAELRDHVTVDWLTHDDDPEWEGEAPAEPSSSAFPLGRGARASRAWGMSSSDATVLNLSDVWVRVTPNADWSSLLAAIDGASPINLHITAGNDTLTTETFGFVLTDDASLSGVSALAADVMPPLENAIGPAYRIDPPTVYDKALAVTIPIPADPAGADTQLMAYIGSGPAPGWHPIQNVLGFASNLSRTQNPGGTVSWTFDAHHGGIVQLTTK